MKEKIQKKKAEEGGKGIDPTEIRLKKRRDGNPNASGLN